MEKFSERAGQLLKKPYHPWSNAFNWMEEAGAAGLVERKVVVEKFSETEKGR